MSVSSAVSSQTPSFRYDLHTKALEAGGSRYVEVSCPDKGNSFRFYEVEYALACGMDGHRDVAALVSWAKSELELDTNASEVSAVIAKLHELDYLEAALAAERPDSTPSHIAVSHSAAMAAPSSAAPSSLVPSSGVVPNAPSDVEIADVELGFSGKSPIEQPPSTPFTAPDVELGIPGPASASVANKSDTSDSSAPISMELGHSGNKDAAEVHDDELEISIGEPAAPSKSVSTDLSQTFRIDQEEVKAAVRASQVMSAVTLPDDLVAELEEAEKKKAKAAAEEAAIPDAISAKDEISEQIAAVAQESKSEATPGSEALAEAIVLPEEKPEKVTPRAEKYKPESKEPSASYALWAVLLLVTILGAGYYYMEYVRDKPEDTSTPVSKRQAPPPMPPVPSAIVKASAPDVSEVLSGKEGTIGSVIESGTEVVVGDVLITLAQAAKIETALARNKKSLAGYQATLDNLKQGKNAARIAKMQAKVTRKEVDVARNIEQLTAFQIVASHPGAAEVVVEAGSVVTLDTLVAKITGQAMTEASFSITKPSSRKPGDELKVVSKADPTVGATCTVTKVEAKSLSVKCPADLPAETEIVVAVGR